MNARPEEISNVIKEQIRNYRSKIEMMETGTVILVGDGIARVYGLRACMASELLEFEDGSFGMAQNLEKETERTQVANDLTTVGGSDGRQPFVKKEVTIGRNDPCPCGSGKKYKNCCGNK